MSNAEKVNIETMAASAHRREIAHVCVMPSHKCQGLQESLENHQVDLPCIHTCSKVERTIFYRRVEALPLQSSGVAEILRLHVLCQRTLDIYSRPREKDDELHKERRKQILNTTKTQYRVPIGGMSSTRR